MLTAIVSLSLFLPPQEPPPGVPADAIAAIRSMPIAPAPATGHLVEVADVRGDVVPGASVVVVPADAPEVERRNPGDDAELQRAAMHGTRYVTDDRGIATIEPTDGARQVFAIHTHGLGKSRSLREHVRIVLEEREHRTISVVDSLGQPAAFVRLWPIGQYREETWRNAMFDPKYWTDASGIAVIGAPGTGTKGPFERIDLTISIPGAERISQTFDVKDFVAKKAPTQPIRLPPTSTLCIMPRSPDGRPMAVDVTAAGEQPFLRGTWPVVFHHVAAETELEISAKVPHTTPPVIARRITTATAGETLEVELGPDPARHYVTLQLVDVDGRPFRGVPVKLAFGGRTALPETTTSEDALVTIGLGEAELAHDSMHIESFDRVDREAMSATLECATLSNAGADPIVVTLRFGS